MPRRGAVLALALFASLLSCGRDVTGPGGRGALVALHIAPDHSAMIDEVDGVMHSVADLVPFTKVRIELRRIDNTVAASEVVDFPEDATEIPLSVNIRLGEAAVDGAEPLTLFLRYINATGDTVFAGGPLSVTAKVVKRGEEPQTVEVPIVPTVPGAVFARVEIAPDTVIANTGSTANFTAQGFDGQDVLVPDAIIGFISRNPALVAVPNLGSGNVNLVGVRGSTWLIAQSLTGLKDSAYIEILPLPTALSKVSGDAQSALTGAPFAQPVRVRVTAADGIGVADWPVNFAVAAGGGTLSASADTTDANGFAEVTWTAGPTAGPGSVTATVTTNSLTTTFTGTQLSTAPTTLAFLTQPVNITAGDSLPDIQVAVRNGAGETITEFTGDVTLGLSNAPGASLVGTTTIAAVAGVATFPHISVNKGGSGFRLTASHDQLPPAQSNAFNVAAAPPTTITPLGGSGQSAPPSTELPDSIRVRITDVFGMPVPGQAVQFSVTQGGGSVSQASVVTDIDGRAGVAWTLGAGGPQQLRASLGQLEQFFAATAVLAGSVELFSGFDYVDVRIGGSRLVPIFLTNPSAEPVEVTLSVHDTATARMAWDQSSVIIPAGTTRLDVPLNGLALGGGWAVMRSAVGDDSLLVVVDSANVGFLNSNYTPYMVGDTIRTLVQLSSRAPAGGIEVVVRSPNPSVAVVAPSSGRGIPEPWYYGGGGISEANADGVSAVGGVSQLLAPLGDSAVIVIPEGQIFGEVAIVILDDLGQGTTVEMTVDAEGFAGSSRTIYVETQFLDLYTYTWADPRVGVGVGQRFVLEFYTSLPRVREQRIHLESSDPLRVVVDSVAIVQPHETWALPVSGTVLGTDTTYVRYWMQGVPMDSIAVIGGAAKLSVDGYTGVPLGGAVELTLKVNSPLNSFGEFQVAAPLVVNAISDNPAVATLERSAVTLNPGESTVLLPVRMLAAGAANIIVTAPGYEPDTVTLSSYASYLYAPLTVSLGAGTLSSVYVEMEYGLSQAGLNTVNVQSMDPGVVQVVSPTLNIGRTSSAAYVQLRGVSPGSTTVEMTGPGLATSVMTVQVHPLTSSLSVQTTMAPDGYTRYPQAYLLANGSVLPLADTSSALLVSSDPAVVEVTDPNVTFTPQNYSSIGGSYRPLTPGTATLSLIRPGIDSVGVTVTVRPYSIAQQWPSAVVGRQLETNFTLYREGPDTLALPITITQSGPGSVSFREFSGEFADGSYISQGRIVGETFGVDTLTISVPGYPDVTKVIYVENTSVGLEYNEGDYAVGGVVEWVYNRFDVTGVPPQAVAGKVLRYLLTSLDTARAVVVQDTIEWLPGDGYGPTRYASVRFKQPGEVSLAITDIDGILPGDTTPVFVYPAELYGSASSYGEVLRLGMGQRTENYETWVSRTGTSPDPLWVRLESSNPSIVQVPDSVLIPGGSFYGYFSVTAGDSTGSARVTAIAPGFNPWRFDVAVTRTQFGIYSDVMYTDGASLVEVYAMDAITFTSRPLVQSVAARFSTSRPDLVDTVGATVLYPAGTTYEFVRGPKGVAVGNAGIELVDDRGERFDNLLPGSHGVEIQAARIESSRSRILLTPGLVSTSDEGVPDLHTSRDSVWLRLAAIGNRFTTTTDSILVQEDEYIYDARSLAMESTELLLRGLAFGEDTLVLSADGMRPDTVLVSVQQGVLRTQQFLPDVVVGDSVYLEISLLDAAAASAAAAESLNISVATDTTFTVRQGGAALFEVPVTEGQSTIGVWLRAEQSGTASVSFSHPSFRSLNLTLNAVERP